MWPSTFSSWRGSSSALRPTVRGVTLALGLAIFVATAQAAAAADAVSTYLGQGAAAYRAGDALAAARLWSEALRLCRLAGDDREANALGRLGEAQAALGLLRDAEASLDQALVLSRGRSDPRSVAALAGALGNVQLLSRRYKPAAPLLMESFDLAQQLGDRRMAAAGANSLGNLLAALGEADFAVAAYQRAIELAGDRDPELVLVARVNQARAHAAEARALALLGAAELAAARRLVSLALLEDAWRGVEARGLESQTDVQQALSIGILAHRQTAADRTVSPRGGAPTAAGDVRQVRGPRSSAAGEDDDFWARLLVWAEARFDRPQLPAPASRPALPRQLAYAALRLAANAAARRGDHRQESLALGYLGEVYGAAGRRAEARALYERALFRAQEANAPEIGYRWEWRLGQDDRAQGDRQAAIGAFARAVGNIQTIRRDIPVEYNDGRSSFRETLEPLYLEYAELLLESDHGSSAAEVPLVQAREVIEQLRVAELQDYYRDSCAVEARSRAIEVERVSPATAVVYPVVFADRIELLVSSPSRMRRFTASMDAAVLRATVMDLRAALESPAHSADWRTPAAALYRVLIAPLLPTLVAEQITTIAYVPDGPLRLIPLAALHDGTRFLIDQFAVATVPGLTLVDPRPLSEASARTLLAGISEPMHGYPALLGVRQELELIAAVMPADTMLDQDFLVARFDDAMRRLPYGVVHIASHGEFGGTPETSYVLTFDSRLRMDQLERIIGYSEKRPRGVELLTLSACRTAAGNDFAPLGLSGVAVQSGARSALGSLWRVSDVATSQLIAHFYQQLRRGGVGKAEALRQAQRSLIRSDKLSHPYYWSPFILIGNWL